MTDYSKYLLKKDTLEYEVFYNVYEEIISEILYSQLDELTYSDWDEFDNDKTWNEYNKANVIFKKYQMAVNAYKDVPEPNDLINAECGYYVNKLAMCIRDDVYDDRTREDFYDENKKSSKSLLEYEGLPGYDNWLTNDPRDGNREPETKITYMALSDEDFSKDAEYIKESVEYEIEQLSKKYGITANKVYEVTSNTKKYLLVESTNGFYKTSNLHDISKYKKIDDVKAKKFIDDPNNMWKGIKVIDTMLQPRTIKLMENHDDKLQRAIDHFYKETGIKLEKVHASKDKVLYHGIDKKNNFEVELELKIKDGGYELDTYGSSVLEFNPSEKPHKKEGTKNKFKLMTDLMYKHFGKL